MEVNPNSPRYTLSSIYKNGKVKGNQRYRCKNCAYQFTKTSQTGRQPDEKAPALILYLIGVSMKSIGRLLKVSTHAVLNWIKKFALDTYEKPE